MSTHIAKARAVKVALGSPDGNQIVRIIRAGDVVPDGVDEKALADLVKRGLVEVAAEPEPEVNIPEGDPTEKWNGAQLDKFAEIRGIDLGGAKNKPEKVAAITAALAAAQAASEAAAGTGTGTGE